MTEIPATPADDDRAQLRSKATQLLLAGNYRDGLALYETRIADKPQIASREWRGEPLAGRSLLIWPEQGLGDKIMFSRFFPQLRALGAELTVLCEPALARLFAANYEARVIVASGTVELPDADFWAFYGSLPLRLGVTLETLPRAAYLQAPAPRLDARIGVATRGNPANPNDNNRSIPPDLAQTLHALPGAISLHFEDLGVRDLLDTAAVIAGLDLVISVDTAVAHLAGALGKPVWIMLPREGLDWRWGYGADAPWYETARLLRQGADRDWRPVIDAVLAELERTGA